jgi:Domain of unknown function (DUF4136)
MSRLASVFAGAVLALPSLLMAQKVEVDYDHGADFSKYHTYRWVATKENPKMTQLAQQRIVAAFDENMAKKGLRRVETDGDVLVEVQGAITEQTQLNTYSTGGPGWGYGAGWGYGWGAAGGMSTTTMDKIPVGVLVFEMWDPNMKQLVFRGVASDTLSDKPEKNTKKINKSAQKMFDKYPPKGTTKNPTGD